MIARRRLAIAFASFTFATVDWVPEVAFGTFLTVLAFRVVIARLNASFSVRFTTTVAVTLARWKLAVEKKAEKDGRRLSLYLGRLKSATSYQWKRSTCLSPPTGSGPKDETFWPRVPTLHQSCIGRRQFLIRRRTNRRQDRCGKTNKFCSQHKCRVQYLLTKKVYLICTKRSVLQCDSRITHYLAVTFKPVCRCWQKLVLMWV